MHLICLGIVKRFITIWFSGDLPLRLSVRQRDIINEFLLLCRNDVPVEFARKPRVITNSKKLRWKATECRSFLLYFGPVILKEVLSEDKYIHFLSLHIATRILMSERSTDPQLLIYAEKLFIYFVDGVVW